MKAKKFRGIDKKTSKPVVGYYRKVWRRLGENLVEQEQICAGGYWRWVEADSVVQYIATDKNGAEVYEGDEVKYVDWAEISGAAKMADQILIEEGYIIKG